MFSLGGSLVQNTHQESRGAVQEASDSSNETSVKKAGELRGNSPGLRRMEQAAHDKVLTWDLIEKDGEKEKLLNCNDILYVQNYTDTWKSGSENWGHKMTHLSVLRR